MVPHLAAGWEVSDDLRSWTFSLREGLTWHDGRPFTADDVLWNFNHILAPETGSSAIGLVKSYLLNDVDTGEVDDDGNPRMTTEIWDANAFENAGLLSGNTIQAFEGFLYFSFVTMTTLGFGDITPKTPQAGAFVTAQAIVGQMYLAVLVARLVGLQITHQLEEG